MYNFESVTVINGMNAQIAVASKEEKNVVEDMNQRIVHVADNSNNTRDRVNNKKVIENPFKISKLLQNITLGFHL